MKKIAPKALFLLLIVALYFASDLYEKGLLLNQALPVPLLGWLFWALVAVAVIDLVVKPAAEFASLVRPRASGSDTLRADAERIHAQLEKARTENELYFAIGRELNKASPDADALRACISEYYGGIDGECTTIIKNYSWKTAMCVVFSRNTIVDAALMFFSQVKMAIALMKQHGRTPSPVFNVLCFFWIASNSALNGIFNQANAENVGELLGTFLAKQGMEDATMTKALSKLGSFAVEAMTAATTVYITGWIINMKLKGQQSELSAAELFKMRASARKALLADLNGSVREQLAPHAELI